MPIAANAQNIQAAEPNPSTSNKQSTATIAIEVGDRQPIAEASTVRPAAIGKHGRE